MKEKTALSFFQPSQVIVVEASAGSGKTYALAKYYLQLLINPRLKSGQIPLRNILAITFTNKAALEMKERILELLKKTALDIFSDRQEEKELLDLFGVDKKTAREKAYLVMEELIRHYNFFQVQTIDSFVNALLTGCALNIDRSANFRIKQDYQNQLAYCLDLVIDAAVTNREVFGFLEEFLRHYIFVENRGGWFPKEDILDLIQSLFQLSNRYGETFRVYPGDSSVIIRKKKLTYGRIKKLAAQFPKGMNASGKKHLSAFLANNPEIFDISSLPAVLKNPKVPMNKGEVSPPGFNKQWKQVQSGLAELAMLEATIIYNPYVKLFRKVMEFFRTTSRRDDVLFLEELNKEARLLFGADGLSVAEVYYRLAARFEHYLIDEFQDTSILQWRNLKMMVEDALASGGSLFYVGDRKQAIYRFRGGEAGLFEDLKKDFFRFNIKTTHLVKNWRSQKAIVEFNNRVFSRQNLTRSLKLWEIPAGSQEKNSPYGEILDIFKDAVQEYKLDNTQGYVSVERLNEKNQKERDEIMRPKILNLLEDLRTRFRFQDIAILTRDNSEVELVTAWCLEAGYPVESEKTLNVIENPLIKSVISLLEFLYSPVDDLSFAVFILSEFFSRATNTSSEKIIDFIFNRNLKQQASRDVPLYRLFRESFPIHWDRYLDVFFKNVGFISPYELVTSIYERFEVGKNFRGSQAFFMKFLELIKANADEHLGLGDLLAYLRNATGEDLYVNVTGSDSLKVLTIHKSKGLEFPAVIIPFLRVDIAAPTGGKGTNSYILPNPEGGLGLLRITKHQYWHSQKLNDIYCESYRQACIDELNNIYVALTRAQFELYIFIPKKSAAGNNKVRFIVPEDFKTQGSKQSYPREERHLQPLKEISPSQYRNWMDFLSEEFGSLSEVRNWQKLREGEILHVFLSRIENCGGKSPAALIAAAAKYVKARFTLPEPVEFYKRKIKNILDCPELRKIFYVSAGQVECEKEVVNKSGELRRIDRLILSEKEAVVVDYKASVQNRQKSAEQVLEYKGIVRDIYPGRRVKAFILYLDTLELEEING